SPFWCGLSGAPGCVTWELILDGYSESTYSATPRFAAARLPWFSQKLTLAILIPFLYSINISTGHFT
ncbi:hypothetical protein MMS54_29870, partial [Escherichia coli]